MRILAVIPARGGSKGIPHKNIAPLCGKPLIAYTIEAAKKASSLDRILVSTDDKLIAATCEGLSVEVLKRPSELASDSATTLSVLQHVVATLRMEGYAPDAVMTLQPTSPLRTARHIDEAAGVFAADPMADSLVSCIIVPHVFHPLSVMKKTTEGYLLPFFDRFQPTRRQEKEPVLARNGAAIYITRTPNLAQYVFGGRLLPYMMTYEESLDIDSHEDLAFAEKRLIL
jgi:CMP-N,N'-diacetyllegionaminic acid synthase